MKEVQPVFKIIIQSCISVDTIYGVDVDRNSTFGNPTDGNDSTVRGIIMKIIYFFIDNF